MNEPVTIDPEFQSLIPPLSEDEYRQLEENCKRDGILDSLKVWKGILIDGHNRYRIAEEWDLNYETCEIDRPSRDAIKAWIANNQLGRRNISDLEKIRLARIARPEIEREAEKRVGGRPKKEEKPPTNSSEDSLKASSNDRLKNETTYKLAKAAGMGREKFKQGEEILDSGNEELIKQVKSGEKTIRQAWLEKREKERKQADLSAKAHLETAKERHDEFKEQKTVTLEDIKQDKKDLAEIAYSKRRTIYNALKQLIFLNSVDDDYSMISSKTIGLTELENLQSELNTAEKTICDIRNSITV